MLADSVGGVMDQPSNHPRDQPPNNPHDRAFAALFRAEFPRVHAYLRRRTGNPETARDLAAETFRLAWEKIAAAQPSPAPPTPALPTPGWLFVTARNLLANAQRKANRQDRVRAAMVGEMIRDPLHGATPGPDALADHRSERVIAALDSLREPDREVLMAHYWDALTGAECAALFGCSVAAVWMRLSRARAAFRTAYITEEDPS
jgi:RNA polymerase sigma-70 factor (ECF subfamily)